METSTIASIVGLVLVGIGLLIGLGIGPSVLILLGLVALAYGSGAFSN